MTSNTSSVDPSSSTAAVTQAPTGKSGPSGTANSTQTISSMSELKEINPELYNMMMQGIAMKVVNDMRDHQQHLKEIMRKARSDAEDR